ncbi:unnamed protein product [Urochloa humidicola]
MRRPHASGGEGKVGSPPQARWSSSSCAAASSLSGRICGRGRGPATGRAPHSTRSAPPRATSATHTSSAPRRTGRKGALVLEQRRDRRRRKRAPARAPPHCRQLRHDPHHRRAAILVVAGSVRGGGVTPLVALCRTRSPRGLVEEDVRGESGGAEARAAPPPAPPAAAHRTRSPPRPRSGRGDASSSAAAPAHIHSSTNIEAARPAIGTRAGRGRDRATAPGSREQRAGEGRRKRTTATTRSPRRPSPRLIRPSSCLTPRGHRRWPCTPRTSSPRGRRRRC